MAFAAADPAPARSVRHRSAALYLSSERAGSDSDHSSCCDANDDNSSYTGSDPGVDADTPSNTDTACDINAAVCTDLRPSATQRTTES